MIAPGHFYLMVVIIKAIVFQVQLKHMAFLIYEYNSIHKKSRMRNGDLLIRQRGVCAAVCAAALRW